MPDTKTTLFTIGHSNHPIELFVGLLKKNRIELVIDVRSSPYSQYASHFGKEVLQNLLAAEGIDYLFLGGLLGGRPEDEQFYDQAGYVLYDRVAESDRFRQAVARLVDRLQTARVTLLCGEEDPTGCHRRLLVGRVLHRRGVGLLHIRGDGRVQSEEDVARQEEFAKTKGQMTLFDMRDAEEWKSTQSVLQKNTRPSSSRP